MLSNRSLSDSHSYVPETEMESLPWSAAALASFRQRMQPREFALLEAQDTPATARLDAVFSLPPDLWPVLPPGSLYCLESHDPRGGFSYLQHTDFPESKVRVSTYYGKWSRDTYNKVDFVVSWQPPRAAMGSAWTAGSGPPPPVLPWEARQVLAHTTGGEYQLPRTRLRFRGCTSALTPGVEPVEWCDVHGIDHADTKAANEVAPRNSDKDRDTHLIDPPKPNTWGEHARRPLIGRLRSGGGGVYMHHVIYDYSGLRTSCGRRVPAGYFFTLAPSAAPTPSASPSPSSSPSPPPGPAPPPGRPSSAPRARRPALSASVSWLDQPPAGGRNAAARTLRTSVSAGHPSAAAMSTYQGSRVASPVGSTAGALSRSPSAAVLTTSASATAAFGGGGSGGGGPAEATPVALTPPVRWRTYGVPFGHAIHQTRAAELAAWVAASGGGGRYVAFSDTAAVMKVAEAHLRLPRAFVPAPLVLSSWADVPRMYAEHMAAARALMPVSDEDASNSTRLHMMLHHLQHAATLEYDRLDAKLALLPQMARLGRKSAEIDAWLQVIVAHATYLYVTLQVTNTQRWPQSRLDPRRSARLLSTSASPSQSPVPSPNAAAAAAHAAHPAPLPDPLAPGPSSGSAPHLLLQPGTPAQASLTMMRPPFMLSNSLDMQPSVPLGLMGPEGSILPAAAAGESVGAGASGGGGPLPRPFVSLDEWAAVTRVMDTCRHAELYEQWVRLRPLMNGTAKPGVYALSRLASSLVPLQLELSQPPGLQRGASPLVGQAGGPPSPGSAASSVAVLPEPFNDGAMNGNLLGFLSADVELMDRPDYDPPPPPLVDFPPARGFRGAGPPPAPRSGPVPAPVRCRGPEETPLPEEVAKTDVWHERTKAGQASPRAAAQEAWREGEAGAVRTGQAAVRRLQAAKAWAQLRQAEVRRGMRSARGLPSPDYVWGPGDPPSAEGDEAGPGPGAEEDDCDAESVMSGLTSSTARSGSSAARWGASERDGEAAGQRRRRGGRAAGEALPECRAPRLAYSPGMSTQTAPRFWEPSEDEVAAAAARARSAADAEVARQLVLSGQAKSREQILDEALAAADAAIASLAPRARPVNATPQPATRSTHDHYHALTHGTEADPAVAYTFEGQETKPSADAADAVWKRLRYGWYGNDGEETGMGDDPSSGGGGGGGSGGGGGEEAVIELQKLDPHTHNEQGEEAPELKTVDVATRKGIGEYGLGTGVMSGFGIVDYETAMARRRAISAAVSAQEAGRNMSRGEVVDLFITFCNLTNRQEMVAELRRALRQPLPSAAAVAAAATAPPPPSRVSVGSAAGDGPRAGEESTEAEAEKQRIRVTAWLLGVTWRRLSNETYASFVCRVMGWPPELAASLPRTRATHIIARALVRGHVLAEVPPPPPRN